jgi:uncharacterized protein (DUF488 family)
MQEKETKKEFTIYTIGFAQKSAQEFFDLLKENKIERVIDIRLRNTNQIAGFTKKQDLEFFLKKLLNCEYYHFPFLAPTDKILDDHRKGGPWKEYVSHFIPLMEQRKALEKLDAKFFQEKKCCLLCSEHTPEECHRRLIAEMLAKKWKNAVVAHLIQTDQTTLWKP